MKGCACTCIAFGLGACGRLAAAAELDLSCSLWDITAVVRGVMEKPMASLQVLHYSESKEDREKAGNLVKGQQDQPETEFSASDLKENAAQLKKGR